MSRANDGAGATDERNDEDAGITSHGVCTVARLRRGLEIKLPESYPDYGWRTVKTVRAAHGGRTRILLDDGDVLWEHGHVWLKVRDRLGPYTENTN